MKYTYAYKTPDGVRHEAAIEAASRDEAFAALRREGIRPIKVVAADGSKANGEVHGVRKRVVVVLVGVVALGVGVAAYLSGTASVPSDTLNTSSFQTDQTRRQVIGDLAVIEKGIRTGWADVFELEGERFLASFAIPGVKAGQRNTSEDALKAALVHEGVKHTITPTISLEAQQIIAMVEGMKAEARAYLAAGGTLIEYGKRLTERQDAEIAIYNRVKADIETAKEKMSSDQFESFCDTRNDELRNLGIRPVVLED